MHISVIGTGYVGLVTGTCFAEFGNDVICVDIDDKKIHELNHGNLPIYEPGLEDLVLKNVKEGRLIFISDTKTAIQKSLVIFIAVGTPPKEDDSTDMHFVENVAKEIAKHLNGYKVIVIKSTVPVGSAKSIESIIRKNLVSNTKFSVASNPEFLREGSTIEDFMHPNRVVIGAESSEAIAILKELYSPLFLIETPFVLTNFESAELIKYASNAFLATKISYINELANFCDLNCENTYEVAKDCDALNFLTEWNQFRSLDLQRIKKLMTSPTIIDLRNIYNPMKMHEMGFNYLCVGRPKSFGIE